MTPQDEPAEGVEPTEPAEPAGAADEPAEPAKGVEPDESAEPAGPTEAADGPTEAAPDLDVARAVPLDGGVRFAGGRSTPPRAAPDDDPIHDTEPPERRLLVPLLAATLPAAAGAGEPAAAAGTRCLLVRLVGDERPSLLTMGEPGVGETLAEAVTSVLLDRLGLRAVAEPRIAEGRVPARLPQPRRGVTGPGWLRAVVVRVEGEPAPGPLVDEVLALPFDEAARALSTDAERRVLGLARE